jgi:hypothetical protein
MEIIWDDAAPSLRFKHPTGTSILVGPLGQIVIDCVNKTTLNSLDDITINSVKNIYINGLTVQINSLIPTGVDISMFGSVGFGMGIGGFGG